MAETFDEILDSLLESYDCNPGKNVDELIAEKAEEFQLSEESKKLINETNKSIDAFEEKYRELDKTKTEDGIGTNTWIRRQLLKTAKNHGCTEEEQELLLRNAAETFEKENQKHYEKGE